MSQPTPNLLLHHLQHSQSERIIWLFEELNLPYELKLHQRAPLLAPESLKAVSHGGTAPVLEDGPLKLGESAAIAHYVLNRYAPGSSLLVPADHPSYPDYLYWFYFIVASLSPRSTCVIFAMMETASPPDAPVKKAVVARFRNHLRLADERLAQVPFFAGDEFTLVDIMALFNFTTGRDFVPYSLREYPNIAAYVTRMTERPAYLRAWRRGDPEWAGIRGVEPEKPALF